MARASNSKNVYAPASSKYPYTFSTSFVENSTNISGNTSNITASMSIYGKNINFAGLGNPCTFQLYWYDNNAYTKGKLLDTRYLKSTTKGTASSWSTTFNVAHKSDGTLSGYVKIVWTKSSGSYTPPSTTLNTANTVLTTIPRASSVSASNADIGSSMTINIGKASTSFTTTLLYSFGSLNGTIASKISNSVYSWIVPTTFYAQIPNSQTGAGTITAVTYNGNTEIGRKSTGFTVIANRSLSAPTISINSVVDTNATTIALTGSNQILVKGYSTARVSISRAVKNSASIRNVYINGVDIGTSATTRDIPNVQTNTFNASITDSRAYSTSTTPLTKSGSNWVDYVPLSLTASFTRNQPTDGKVNLTYRGNYFNGSFGENSNTLTVRYRYKLASANSYSAWVTLTPTISGNSYSQTLQLSGTFNYQQPYDFQIQAIDKIFTSGVSVDKAVAKGEPVYWWNKTSFNTNVDTNVVGTMHAINMTSTNDVVAGNVSLQTLNASVYKTTNYAVLTGVLTVLANNSASVQLNYPTGFTQSNCVPIACGVNFNDTNGYCFLGQGDGSQAILLNAPIRYLNLKPSSIGLLINNSTTAARAFSYKIVLMRYT